MQKSNKTCFTITLSPQRWRTYYAHFTLFHYSVLFPSVYPALQNFEEIKTHTTGYILTTLLDEDEQ